MEKKTSFRKQLAARWTAPNTKFHDKIRYVGNWCSGFGLALFSIPAAVDAINKDININLSILGTVAGYFVVAGLIATAIANTTVSSGVKDPIIDKS